MMSKAKEITSAKYAFKTQYDRGALETKIVHLGFGAFHRGHQAVYNDLTNQTSGDLWGICEINMFGPADLIDNLNDQDRLFTVVEKSANSTSSRLVRTITEAIHTTVSGIESAINKMIEPQIKIVSLTITEKGYCVDPQAGSLDAENILIKHDLMNPSKPQSAIGLITESLRIRREKGLAPFTVLSCDNIPENGHLTKNAVLAFAQHVDSVLANWIEESVSFPSTMVDRIVPAMTPEQFKVIEKETGYADPCGVVCEDFRQWVIEDNFVSGRPNWDKAGAMFVSDVLPYEEMKLRMLNGSHSFLAYNGSLAGYEYIYQCMEDEQLRAATLRLMTQEQAKSLSKGLNVDLDEYAQLLIGRFSNSNIKHKTGQIAMDGSQKLPQRAVDPYLELQKRDVPRECLPTLIAGWIHYVISLISKGQTVSDPLESVFLEIVERPVSSIEKAMSFLLIEKVFGQHGIENKEFSTQVENAFITIEREGIQSVIHSLANI
jgi:fructuronate reductase